MRVLMALDYRDTNPYQKLLAEALDEEGVTVKFPAGYRRGLPLLRSTRTAQANILHLHWPTHLVLSRASNTPTRILYSLRLAIEVLLVRLIGTKVVWTVHNVLSHGVSFSHVELYTRRLLAQVVDSLLVHDHNTASEVAQHYCVSEKKVNVIPHGNYRSLYTDNPSKKEARNKLGITSEGCVFLYFGSVRPYKGIEDLLEAWDLHTKLHPDDLLILAGSPRLSSYGRKITEIVNATDRVLPHLSFVDESDVPTFFAAADVAAFPFRRITTSGSLILAMSFGVPVIAPGFASVRAVLDGADDLVYHPTDNPVDSLKETLDTASKKPNKSLARRTVAACDRLDWGNIAKDTRHIYEDLL